MSRTYKTEGIILKRSNCGEADKLLTIFTKHYGKIRAIAKGVRKTTSRKGGNVELFNHGTIFLAQGRNLDILTEIQCLCAFRSWRRDLRKVAVAYYFCELVDKLTPDGQDNQQVFGLLQVSLAKIESDSLPELIKSFEEQLLIQLGFGVPANARNVSGGLRNYIESIIEKRLNSPRFLIR